MSRINTLELFAGCGGLLDGLKQTDKIDTLACVEWEKEQCKVLKNRLQSKYGYNNADEIVMRFDIQRTEELLNGWFDDDYGQSKGLVEIVGDKKVQVISGGPPCQAYSLAGRIQDPNNMNNDYRNFLFESYLKVVEKFQPDIFVFENVEGILSASPGGINIIERIKEDFSNVDYEIVDDVRKFALIDLSEYGVPQKRKRVILVGIKKKGLEHLDIQDILHNFYTKILVNYKDSQRTVYDAIHDLPKLYPIAEGCDDQLRSKKKLSHITAESNIPQHIPRYHNARDIEIFRELAEDIESGRNEYTSTKALQELYTLRTGKQSNIHKYNVLRWDKPSNTIPAHLKKDGLRHIHPDPKQARSITVREAARLQTFDDDFIFSGIASKDYEMIGNAVPPKFGLALGNAIIELLEDINNKK